MIQISYTFTKHPLPLCIPLSCMIQFDCKTPSGDNGSCISIMDCQPLLELVQKKDRTTDELRMLRQSQCGYDGGIVKVCCEIPDNRCYNPDGNLGLCIGLNTCPVITKMIEPLISTNNLEFIRNSRCEGSDEYSVCCGPDHKTHVAVPLVCEPSSAPPDPRTECCGLESSSGNKIMGGTAAAIDQYPWLALIQYTLARDDSIDLLCGGSLISSKYVLTASHCVFGPILNAGKPEYVRFGEYDVTNDGPDCVTLPGGGLDCTNGSILIPIEKVIPHRLYDPASKLNDIALIRMVKNVEYTDFIRPICLPTSDITLSNQNIVLYAAGWGAVSSSEFFSNIKQYVSLPYKPLQECQEAYNFPKRKLKLWKGQMCAGGEKGRDTCRGDSGGPLMHDNGRIFTVVGVVSFGTAPCALKDVPAVYTKVNEYIPWIRTIIKP